jgi:two-component system, response regulator PdtaR
MNRQIKVLVAEDERIIAMDLKHTLQKLGYEVTSVVNTAVDVIQKVETEKPDVILMDIMLDSLLDGIEAAKIISYKYNVPFIYVTALNDEKTLKRAQATHPFDYLIKPYDEVSLHDKIQSAVKSRISVQQGFPLNSHIR